MFQRRTIRYSFQTMVVVLVMALPVSATLFWSPQDDVGQAVWEKQCQKCHGADGTADTKAGKMLKVHDLTTGEWDHGTSQEEVEKVVREGVPKMPGYAKKLSAEEITAVSLHARKLGGVAEE